MMKFKEVILLKYGELILKGLNKSRFENQLLNDLAKKLKKVGSYKITKAQSTVYVFPQDDDAAEDIARAYEECKKVFGIVALCRACEVEKDMDAILATLPEYIKPKMEKSRTFKVETTRSDKHFPLQSPEISKLCGGAILSRFPHLKVDVENPDVVVRVEIRDFGAYLHCGTEDGAGGMPKGSAGKALLLLSGGIDSPVAGFLTAKRGVTVDAVHFESYPYTSEQAREKVVELANIMCDYMGGMYLNVISVTHIQEEIRDKCREEYFTLILRRFMMRLAQRLALKYDDKGIITGESIGQVASQTHGAMAGPNAGLDKVPAYRPLIAMDIEEIIKISRKIGTYDTSILPYEDCCTVFTPRHPVTNPILENIEKEEQKLDVEALVEEALAGTVKYILGDYQR